MPNFGNRYFIGLWVVVLLAFLSRTTAIIPLPEIGKTVVWIESIAHQHATPTEPEQETNCCSLVTEESTNDLTRHAKESFLPALPFPKPHCFQPTVKPFLNYNSWIKTFSLFILHGLLRI